MNCFEMFAVIGSVLPDGLGLACGHLTPCGFKVAVCRCEMPTPVVCGRVRGRGITTGTRA